MSKSNKWNIIVGTILGSCLEYADKKELIEFVREAEAALDHPCKPGDTIYWILDDDGPYVSSGEKVVEVGTMGFFVGDSFDGKHETDGLVFIPFDFLGKDCFLSPEEAEAAIAEREE